MGMAELFPSLHPKAFRLMGFCERDFSLPVNVGHLPTGVTDNFIWLVMTDVSRREISFGHC